MTLRQLRPEYMLNGKRFNLFSEEKKEPEHSSFDEEIERSHRELGEALKQQRKERWDYLIEIDRMQNLRETLPWPYDLCKMSGDDEETLQWARKYDHLYDYVREYPKYEYDPNNYLNVKKLPKYDYTVDTDSEDDYEFDNDSDEYDMSNIFDYNYYNESDSDKESLPDYSKFKSFIGDYGKDIINDEGWTTVGKKKEN